MNSRRFVVACLAAVASLAFYPVRAADRVPEVRVMSYNIRYGTARDGDNRWDRRKDFLIETVRAFNPDLVGTQETLVFQRDYLAQHLVGYEAWGVGRDDGKTKGEFAALFYKTARFDRLDGGNFWLSQTPDKASRGWDSAEKRIVSWVKLRDRMDPARTELVYFNTHFDHRGVRARLESARLLRRKIDELARGRPVIVTGDFNAAAESEPYRVLFAASEGTSATLFDTYSVQHAQRGPQEGTFSGFRPGRVSGARIDWIGCSSDWRVLKAEIDHTQRDGHTPSDHFPVTAVLRHKE